MITGRIGAGLAITLSILMGPLSLVASAAENDSGTAPNLTPTKLIERMDRLENRVTDLEAQVVTLKREKTEAQTQLKRQQQADAASKSPTTATTTSLADKPLQGATIDPRDERPAHDLISSYGVRAGYQGFPFGQKEGGFFYGVFLDHLLVAQEEGMPQGDLDLEFGAGVAFSGADKVTVNSVVVGAPTTVDFRQRMISVWPDLKYRYNLLKSYGLVPYLTGGPGIWVDIIETPPLVGGLQFPPPELLGRKLPETAGASLFEGAQGGAGFDLSLARLHHPIFERMKVGFDYRYSAWTTGQRFSTYSLLLSYSD